MKNLLAAALAHGLCWAIEPVKGQALLSEFRPDPEPGLPTPAALSLYGQSRDTDRDRERPYRIENGVALIPIVGAMTKNRSWYYSGTSTALVRNAVRMAGTDEKVKGILLFVDSPGGSVDGIQELADDIAAVAKLKTVTTFCEDSCFSAAYWPISQSSRIVVNAAGSVGSLGIMMTLVDSSKAAEQAGLEFLLFKTGELKGGGGPGIPIDEGTRQLCQRLVNEHGERFSASIAKGRKMTAERVKEVFTGDIFSAKNALAFGLVDAIGSLDEAFADLVASIENDEASGVTAATDLGPTAGPAAALATTPHVAPSATVPSVAPTPKPISAPGGQPGPAGTHTAPTQGAGNPKAMKEKLTQALARLGLGKMVAALTVSNSEDPEVMAQTIAGQVEAEANDRVANHPIITLAKANGIESIEKFSAAMDMKRLGESHLTQLRGAAETEAIRAYGPETGPMISAQVNHLPHAQVKTLHDSWQAAANAKFGIGGNGQGAPRLTAPANATAVDVEQPTAKKRLWERLPAEDRATAAKSCDLSTEAKQDAFAESLFAKTPQVFGEAI